MSGRSRWDGLPPSAPDVGRMVGLSFFGATLIIIVFMCAFFYATAPLAVVPGSPKPAYKDAVRRESVLVASAWQAAGVRLFNLDHQLAESEEKSAHMSRRSGPSSRGRSMRRSRQPTPDTGSPSKLGGKGATPAQQMARSSMFLTIM